MSVDISLICLTASMSVFCHLPLCLLLLQQPTATIPTVIVGPSHFAVEHPTVRHASSTQDYQGFGRPRTATVRVISPGVDVTRFDPGLFHGEHALPARQYHDECRLLHSSHVLETSRFVKPFVVGFVGRLSVEKNVGLFLLAAQSILQTCSHCRFTVVGDGALRSKLELLCAQLDITWALHFAGEAQQHDQSHCAITLSELLVAMRVPLSSHDDDTTQQRTTPHTNML